jgi:Uma2 family endonuclease
MIAALKQEQKKSFSQEFLAWERQQKLRHELIDGKIYSMGGASKKHNQINFNLNGLLYIVRRMLKNFTAFSTDMRTFIPLKESYVYPDIVVVKGEDKYLDKEFDTLTNPTIVFEVLLKSTKQFDKSKKFICYRSINSLKEYILISQVEFHVVHYYKNAQSEWVIGEILTNEEDVLTLKNLDIQMPLKDIYEGILMK